MRGVQLQQLQLLHTGVQPVAAQLQQPQLQLQQQAATPHRSGGGAAPGEPGGMSEGHAAARAAQRAPAGHAAACTPSCAGRAAEHGGGRAAAALPATEAGRGDATWEAGAFLGLGPPRHAASRGADPVARSPPADQRAARGCAAAHAAGPSVGLPPASTAGTAVSGGAPDSSPGGAGQASWSSAPGAGLAPPGNAASGSARSAGHAALGSTAVGSSDSVGGGSEASSSDWGSAAEDGAWAAAPPRPPDGGAPARRAVAGPCPDPEPESCSSSGMAPLPPVRALVPRGVGWSDSDADNSDGREDARLLAKYGIRHDPAPRPDPHRARARARHAGRRRGGAAEIGIDARLGVRLGATKQNRDRVEMGARQRPREADESAVGGGGADWATPNEDGECRCSRCCSPDIAGSVCQHGLGGHAKAHRASVGSGRNESSAQCDMHARRPAALRARRRARAGAVAGGCSGSAPSRNSSAASSSATLASSPAEPDLHGELVLLRGALGRGAAALTLGGELASPPSKAQRLHSELQVGSDMGAASAAPQAPLLPELSVESRRYLARYGLMPSSVSAASGGEVGEAGTAVALSMSSVLGAVSSEGVEQSG